MKNTKVTPSQMTKKYEIRRGIRYRFANFTVSPSYLYLVFEERISEVTLSYPWAGNPPREAFSVVEKTLKRLMRWRISGMASCT